MDSKTREYLNNWVPPAMLRSLKCITKGIRWSGNYTSWAEAQQASMGYDSDIILEAVREALLKVKHGQAAYERDTFLFYEEQYSWSLLAALMWVAATSEGVLNVLDFGGSLGSTYFQNKNFLQYLIRVRWNIVEQHHFVDCGKRDFEDETLNFYYDIETCVRRESPNAILLSSVIQYLETPYIVLEKIVNLGFKYIIVDRTAFYYKEKDRLTIQKVPSGICDVSYAAWFLNRKKFLDVITRRYNVLATWADSVDVANIPSTFDGYIFTEK